MSESSAVNQSLERVRRALAAVVPPPREKLAGNDRAAAVLVPIFERDGTLHVVYIRRSDQVASHRGQVAFPGGRVDPADQTVLDTALREAHEEVGIPPDAVEVLGALPTATTYTSGILVSPFAGLIPDSTPL
ncbi:MAG TPA: CoA pyrophosphatase, partial [Candidatus Binataceae bacterium]|nr:CoA pyrophosphatase [Candidatus Binataceae bacterium]